jgi:FkbM family methyltransferase
MMQMYYGQNHEDKYIQEFFPFGYIGNCLEIGGGSDGITHSNTYYFEKKGWNALVVEAQPNFAMNIKNNRKNVLNAAVTSKSSDKIDFNVVYCNGIPWGGMSSLVVDERLIELHKNMGFIVETKKIKVPSLTLQDCVLSHFPKGTVIDFISVDTEGTELDVIKSINFEDIMVKLLIIENNFGSSEIGEYLTKIGWKKEFMIEQNEFYINTNTEHR